MIFSCRFKEVRAGKTKKVVVLPFHEAVVVRVSNDDVVRR
jgi:hypothetical protein